jgi:hypothetical protein
MPRSLLLPRVVPKDLRGLQPQLRENREDRRDWRDRGGRKLGKLELLGQPEDWDIENREHGSPHRLSTGNRGMQPAGMRIEGCLCPSFRIREREARVRALPSRFLKL